jgi:hypothetical protein
VFGKSGGSPSGKGVDPIWGFGGRRTLRAPSTRQRDKDRKPVPPTELSLIGVPIAQKEEGLLPDPRKRHGYGLL